MSFFGEVIVSGTITEVDAWVQAKWHNQTVRWDFNVSGFMHDDFIDDINDIYVYWANWDEGKIQRANLDGSNTKDLITRLNKPTGIAPGILPVVRSIGQNLELTN